MPVQFQNCLWDRCSELKSWVLLEHLGKCLVKMDIVEPHNSVSAFGNAVF